MDHGCEKFIATRHRKSRSPRNHHLHNPALALDSETQHRGLWQDLELLGLNDGAHDGRAHRHRLVWIDFSADIGLSEVVLKKLLDVGNASGPSYQDDLANALFLELRLLEDVLHGLHDFGK